MTWQTEGDAGCVSIMHHWRARDPLEASTLSGLGSMAPSRKGLMHCFLTALGQPLLRAPNREPSLALRILMSAFLHARSCVRQIVPAPRKENLHANDSRNRCRVHRLPALVTRCLVAQAAFRQSTFRKLLLEHKNLASSRVARWRRRRGSLSMAPAWAF